MRNYLIGCSIFAALFGASVVSVRAVPAGGEPVEQTDPAPQRFCGPLDKILEAAKKQFHEDVVFNRVGASGARFTITATDKTFTLIIGKPDGSLACVEDNDPQPAHTDPDMQEQHL